MKNLIYTVSLLFILISCSKSEDQKILAEDFQRININTSQSLTDINFYDTNNGVVCGTVGFLSKTNDGGNTWSTLNVGIKESFRSTYMPDQNTIFTGRNSLYNSKNSGQTFSEIGNLSTKSISVFGFHFFNSNTGIIINPRQVLKTENGGINWEVKYSDATSTNKLQFTSVNIGYIAGGSTNAGVAGGNVMSYGEMHKSIDNGNTWTNLNLNTSEITAMYFSNDNLGFFSNYNGELFKTTNGGVNWTKVSQISSSYITSMVFIDESLGYLTNTNGEILITKNSGVTWNITYNKTTTTLTKIIKTQNAIYAIGNEGLVLKMKNITDM